MSDFTETQASALIGTAEKMIEIWSRLSPEKQSALLARFGTQENALAALVTTHLVAPGTNSPSIQVYFNLLHLHRPMHRYDEHFESLLRVFPARSNAMPAKERKPAPCPRHSKTHRKPRWPLP